MDIGEIALEFCGRGGKRLRPRLCKAAFERCGGTGDIGGVCEAIECFHKASLIHDDIQDGDEERYGRPTVWKEHGVPVAIAAGDWLVAHGYRLITESGFAAMPQMIRAAVLSHVRLCEGQGDDLLNTSTSQPVRLRIGLRTQDRRGVRPCGAAGGAGGGCGRRAVPTVRPGVRCAVPDQRRHSGRRQPGAARGAQEGI